MHVFRYVVEQLVAQCQDHNAYQANTRRITKDKETPLHTLSALYCRLLAMVGMRCEFHGNLFTHTWHVRELSQYSSELTILSQCVHMYDVAGSFPLRSSSEIRAISSSNEGLYSNMYI